MPMVDFPIVVGRSDAMISFRVDQHDRITGVWLNEEMQIGPNRQFFIDCFGEGWILAKADQERPKDSCSAAKGHAELKLVIGD